MSHVSDPANALGVGFRKLAPRADELQRDPATDGDQRRQPHDPLIGQELHCAARKHHDVSAEDTRDGAGGAQIRQCGVRNVGRLCEHRENTRNDIEDEKAEVTEIILNIVAERPEIGHVADQV